MVVCDAEVVFLVLRNIRLFYIHYKQENHYDKRVYGFVYPVYEYLTRYTYNQLFFLS